MLEKLYRAARRRARPLKRMLSAGRSNSKIFTEVYEKRLWGGKDKEYFSGPGSYAPCVPEYVAVVRGLIKSRNFRSVMEIGCGDFAVASQYADDCESYLGLDVVKALVERNTNLFGNERIKFAFCDASKQKLAPVDLCIIRQVLQHLSNKDISKVLANITAKCLLITEHLPAPENTIAINSDKASGGDIRAHYGSGVFIDHPPFNINATVLLDRQIEPDGSRLVTWIVS